MELKPEPTPDQMRNLLSRATIRYYVALILWTWMFVALMWTWWSIAGMKGITLLLLCFSMWLCAKNVNSNAILRKRLKRVIEIQEKVRIISADEVSTDERKEQDLVALLKELNGL